jgi:hypothetical protein
MSGVETAESDPRGARSAAAPRQLGALMILRFTLWRGPDPLACRCSLFAMPSSGCRKVGAK